MTDRKQIFSAGNKGTAKLLDSDSDLEDEDANALESQFNLAKLDVSTYNNML